MLVTSEELNYDKLVDVNRHHFFNINRCIDYGYFHSILNKADTKNEGRSFIRKNIDTSEVLMIHITTPNSKVYKVHKELVIEYEKTK